MIIGKSKIKEKNVFSTFELFHLLLTEANDMNSNEGNLHLSAISDLNFVRRYF